MAITARETISSALRKVGILRAGGQASDGAATDALSSLSSWYQELITNGTCGRVRDIPVSGPLTATSGAGQHINVLNDEAVTITPPDIVPYYYWDTYMPARDYGWGLNVPLGDDTGENVPTDLSVLRITSKFNNDRATYIYDGTIQRWVRIDNLTLDSETPLSARSPDGVAAVLATRLVDQYGDTLLSVATVQAANRYRLALVSNYNRENEYAYW